MLLFPIFLMNLTDNTTLNVHTGPKKVVVERGSSVDDLKQRILQVFPVSTATNLILKKCRQDNGYRLVPVEAFTLHQLKKNNLEGALYAMPLYGVRFDFSCLLLPFYFWSLRNLEIKHMVVK